MMRASPNKCVKINSNVFENNHQGRLNASTALRSIPEAERLHFHNILINIYLGVTTAEIGPSFKILAPDLQQQA
jgi:hypothetical protein